jgi:beta-N-acetylhexosaminidase
MVARAFICGIEGLTVSAAEQRFLRDSRPWGVILFARNVDTPVQLRALTDQLRDITGRDDLPILVDQEGGRVQRLKKPHWPRYPAAQRIGALYVERPKDAARAAWLSGRLIGQDLADGGLNVDCLPVADLSFAETHDVIGDRAYHSEPGIVAELGRAAADGLMAAGVAPVLKHIPGHGRATADSHLELPIVEAAREDLERLDFAAFAALADLPMAMTAHIIFTALDAERPVTQSAKTISEIIRQQMGFDGLLMTDDLSMKALSGTFAERTSRCFEAGCDVVLHCNGDMAEMSEVAEMCPELTGDALRRALAAMPPEATDADLPALRAEFADLLDLDPDDLAGDLVPSGEGV